jgi:hypothetical protein
MLKVGSSTNAVFTSLAIVLIAFAFCRVQKKFLAPKRGVFTEMKTEARPAFQAPFLAANSDKGRVCRGTNPAARADALKRVLQWLRSSETSASKRTRAAVHQQRQNASGDDLQRVPFNDDGASYPVGGF